MPTSLSGRDFLRLLDFTTEEIEYLLKLSREFKNLKLTGTPHRYLEGKNIVLLFQKTSTRTRCAFEVGAMDLGMGVTYLDRPFLRRHRIPRLRAVRRGRAGCRRFRAGVERPDHRVASHPDAR